MVVTADARVVSIGSANLDVTASYWEREANVIIEDAAVASAIEAQIQEMLARSYAVDPDSEYWRAEVHLMEGGQSYDLMGRSREQVIADVLAQYERHLHYLDLIR